MSATWLRQAARRGWALLRRLSGDDAYERFCVHQRSCHPGARLPSRAQFCAQEQQRRWSGVSRCC